MERTLKLNINSDQIRSGLRQVDSSLKQTGKQGDQTAKQMQKSAEQTTARFDRLKASIGGIFTLMAASSFAKTIGEFQALDRSLGVVYGSVAKGNAVFRDLQQLALDTPFSVQQLTNSVIKLRAAGIEPTTAQLSLFSDVASVTTDKVGTLNAMTDLFSRTTAGGLGLEDLNRLADRGIPVFDILSEKMGLARLEVAKFGQSAEGANQILRVLTDEMQVRFGGAAKDAAEDLSNQISNMGVAWDGMQTKMGTAGGLAIATALVAGATSTINFFGENLDTLGIIIGGLSTLAIPAMIAGVKALTVAMLANPVAVVVVALTGLMALAWTFRDTIWEALVKTFEVTLPNSIDHALIGFLKMKKGVGELMNDMLTKINDFGNSLITSAPDWLKGFLGIDGNTFKLGIDIAAVNSQIDELEATINGRISNFKKPDPIAPKVGGASVGGLSTDSSLTGVGGSGSGSGGGDDNDPYLEGLQTRSDALALSLLTDEEKIRLSYDNRTLIAEDAFAFGLIGEEERNTMLLGLTQDYEAEKTAITARGEADRRAVMSAGLGAAASIFSSISQLMQKEGEKQSTVQKILAKAAIVTSTAQAIMNALAVPPYPLGVSLAAAAAAQGALQLSKVGGGGSAATAAVSTPVSSATSLSATPIATPTQTAEPRGETVIQFTGNFTGWNDEVIDDLTNAIASAVDDRDIRLISPTSRNAQDLAGTT